MSTTELLALQRIHDCQAACKLRRGYWDPCAKVSAHLYSLQRHAHQSKPQNKTTRLTCYVLSCGTCKLHQMLARTPERSCVILPLRTLCPKHQTLKPTSQTSSHSTSFCGRPAHWTDRPHLRHQSTICFDRRSPNMTTRRGYLLRLLLEPVRVPCLAALVVWLMLKMPPQLAICHAAATPSTTAATTMTTSAGAVNATATATNRERQPHPRPLTPGSPSGNFPAAI